MRPEYEKEISVIMGVYNQWDREALLAAVQSVISQTFDEFEFIIYDDGSDEEAAAYIRELQGLDPRLVLIGKEENHGLAFSLNACIDAARGRYLARMDADDISLPERLEVQYQFLEAHPEYAWCGCNAELFDASGIWGERKMPEIPKQKDYLPFSPFIHPSVMYRRQIFEENEGYHVSRETLRCEDYEIFMRLVQMGYQGYNIQRCLFRYREDFHSFQRRRLRFRLNETKLRYRNFCAMHMLFPFGWFYVLRPLAGGLLPASFLSWLKRQADRKPGRGQEWESGHAADRKPQEVAALQADIAGKSGI